MLLLMVYLDTGLEERFYLLEIYEMISFHKAQSVFVKAKAFTTRAVNPNFVGE